MPMRAPQLGATVEAEGVRFRLWAPKAQRVNVLIESAVSSGASHQVLLDPEADGYFSGMAAGAGAGLRYRYLLDEAGPWPDPASRFQPDGVHGASEVVDAAYAWRDARWTGVPQQDLVFYELHVGTFSPEGTFDGVRRKLPYLRDLGVTALELMPVADFPGRWNWGYDPAAFWAPSRAFGRPEDLRALVDEAHQLGLAVFLDVVYNHFGPDGAYVVGFGPYLTDEHHTPWGRAVNLSGKGSAPVRDFFTANALHWLSEYHIDGLRLDAVFALVDDSPQHWLAELAEHASTLPGPPRLLIAEDNRNLDTLVRPVHEGGFGLHGLWSDDFHHLVRRYVAGDQHGYFVDYPTSTQAIAETITQGWYYKGQHAPFFGGPRGSDPKGLPPERFVLCIQNHDQVGNRPAGDRLCGTVTPAAYRAATALALFVPQLPLLFMGQEWAASSPFIYFTDHNPELGRCVREGRRKEFGDFPGFHGEVPDPQSPNSFEASKLRWEETEAPGHVRMLRLYRDLLRMRRDLSRFDLRAESPVDGGIVVGRGETILLVALRPGIALPTGANSQIGWHSEQPEYVEDPQVPLVRAGEVYFPCEAALILRPAAAESGGRHAQG